jgi:DNA-binding LacI/PurR family transcriptional regulator/DNA-binding transcriptional regulator YhcF (GntR family)
MGNPDSEQRAVYKQIEGTLRRQIIEGKWQVGAIVPSRRNLAKQYGVSPITIERAITGLIADGLLRADDRRGTFVAPPPTEIDSPHPMLRLPSRESPPVRSVLADTVGIVSSLYRFNTDHLELNNYWVGLLIESLEQELSKGGHTTHFFNRVQEKEQPPLVLSEAIEAAMQSGVGAIAVIAYGPPSHEVDDHLALLHSRHFPAVCITSGPLRRPVPHVFVDNRSGGYEAAYHLLRHGCRHLVFLSPFHATWMENRIEGARAAVEHAHLPAENLRIFPETTHPWVQEEDPQVLGYGAAKRLFAESAFPTQSTGIICINDGVAFGLLEAALEHGIEVGKDLAVISFDDHREARNRHLTSLRPPMETMGVTASRLLLQTMRGEAASLQSRMPWHLIPRSSSRISHASPYSTESNSARSDPETGR